MKSQDERDVRLRAIHRVDLFSIAKRMYRILTGKYPYNDIATVEAGMLGVSGGLVGWGLGVADCRRLQSAVAAAPSKPVGSKGVVPESGRKAKWKEKNWRPSSTEESFTTWVVTVVASEFEDNVLVGSAAPSGLFVLRLFLDGDHHGRSLYLT